VLTRCDDQGQRMELYRIGQSTTGAYRTISSVVLHHTIETYTKQVHARERCEASKNFRNYCLHSCNTIQPDKKRKYSASHPIPPPLPRRLPTCTSNIFFCPARLPFSLSLTSPLIQLQAPVPPSCVPIRPHPHPPLSRSIIPITILIPIFPSFHLPSPHTHPSTPTDHPPTTTQNPLFP
jgi:hypothetical protein